MTNTIELLESIGQDASLRHTSSVRLAQALSKRGASGTLQQAAALRDSCLLAAELGAGEKRLNTIPTQIHSPWNDGEDEPDVDADDDKQDDKTAEPEK